MFVRAASVGGSSDFPGGSLTTTHGIGADLLDEHPTRMIFTGLGTGSHQEA